MNRVSTNGTPLFKRANVRIFLPDDKGSVLRVLRAPNGQWMTRANIEEWLSVIAAAIQKDFPAFRYRMVQVGSTSFNFVLC